MQTGLPPRKCKYCGSDYVVRFGYSKQVQRLLCKNCGHTYMDNESLPGMKVSRKHILSAIKMYYGGISLNNIRKQMEQLYNIYPSDSTVYHWITNFTKVTIKEAHRHRPNVGDTWIIDETEVTICSERYRLIDILDTGTGFLLTTKLFHDLNINDMRSLIASAEARAGKVSRPTPADDREGYSKGMRLNHANATKVRFMPIAQAGRTKLLESFQRLSRSRTRLLQALKGLENVPLMLEGWLVYYNYFLPQEPLDGQTPAQRAGVRFDTKTQPLFTTSAVKLRTKRI